VPLKVLRFVRGAEVWQRVSMRVLVAMSGGVDSSAAAALLKEQGHEVFGMTLRVWSYESKAQCGSCCSPEDIDDARAVAERLGIPFYVANVEELFKERVVSPFVQSYLSGSTPIPCVACNQDVKFGFLLKKARQLGAKLATGHYAQIDADEGRKTLKRGADASKDQSYFLFTLNEKELDDVIFPVKARGAGYCRAARVVDYAQARKHGNLLRARRRLFKICRKNRRPSAWR
jgi:tRNA-uridine 2-sulfurtransferase